MSRPVCKACKKRPAAVNCHRDDKIYYRSRCDACIRKGRKEKPPVPRWSTGGYKKKLACDRCGFRSQYKSQLLVYHINGDLNDNESLNLRTICLNCAEAIQREDLPWRPGDLEADH